MTRMTPANGAPASTSALYTGLGAAADHMDDQLTGSSSPPDADEPQRWFSGVDTFVDEFVLPQWRYRLDTEDVRWCARWWEHTAALGRLEALWEAFEAMRLEGGASLSTWYRNHFDVHMTVLTQRNGVFHRCSAERGVHEQPPVWPHEQVPPGFLSTGPIGGNDE
ncbi:DUF4913 domain-containing protein [Allobranchiibius sp. GilTou38]|uniref:DUF4913 domain-containing protein n=1 Tax=Allobranchiibius sp. GilTou38 TaxID=2815210 RepID=UPI001AA0FF4A|nr:DUF4913 domain-containing protein [Allobranchiibius sp. GilTou38]MBO1768250.1 DUF4913 domain-containing protein [Allobranchiibius sp. GilTou38]